MTHEEQQSSAPRHSSAPAHQCGGLEAPHIQQQRMQPQLQGSGHSHAGKRESSSHDSAAKTQSRKRTAVDRNNIGAESAVHDRLAVSSLQAEPALQLREEANGNQTGVVMGHGGTRSTGSEDTRSNGGGAFAADTPREQSADVQDQGGNVDGLLGQELVAKLAANLQMALKALSILKGADPTVFENLQPVDLAKLDLQALCQTPGSTP